MNARFFKPFAAAGLFAAACLTAWAEYVFVPGTYAGDTRYNVTKLDYGDSGPDHDLCWAASAANNLQLWQDNLVKAGYSLPAGTPNGKNQPDYLLDIFDVFAKNWTDAPGCSTFAYQWYLTGAYDPSYAGGAPNVSQPIPGATGGGYFKDWGFDMDDLVVRMDCQAGSWQYPVEGAKDMLKNAIDTIFENGWLASVSLFYHSVTLAGYEFDPITGDITGLWVCDSDNPNTDSNYLLDIEWVDGYQGWMFTEAHIDEDDLVSDYNNLVGEVIMRFDVFKVPPMVPEPSSFALAAGILSACFAAARRRRA